MRREKFTEFMRHPEKVGSDDLQELEALVNHYPYFQAARMLYLKVLYLQAGSRFRHELKTSTVHITDHKHLLQYLNLLPGTHLRDIKNNVNNVCQDADINKRNEQSVEIENTPNAPEEHSNLTDNETDSIVSLNFDTLHTEPLPLDLETEESEVHNDSFITPEIISSGYALPEEENFQNSANGTDKKNKNNQLIDNFIKSNPSMPKSTEASEDTRDLSEENPYANDELLTETLAKIYTKQKLYEKAITTYIKLSLKFPEKSVYFANRIEKIKEIINNQE